MTEIAIVRAIVIACEGGGWGVAIKYSNGNEVTYHVGTREDAQAEVHRVKTDPDNRRICAFERL